MHIISTIAIVWMVAIRVIENAYQFISDLCCLVGFKENN